MGNLLEKVITTSNIGEGTDGRGLLSPQQADRFIDYMWDATTLGAQVRTVKMNGNEVELDRIAVGEHLMRLATEAVDDGVNARVAFAKVSVNLTKLRLDWELSSESLEDNIEGEALEDHIARLMSAQAANDIEDLAINGDTAGHSGHHLFKSFDGWRKRLYSGATVLDATTDSTDVVGATAGTLHRGIFNKALRAMPRRYMNNRGSLRFLTSAGLLQDYMYAAQVVEQPGQFVQPEGDRNNVAPTSAPGWSPTSPFGIRASEVPLFPEYDVSTGVADDTETPEDESTTTGSDLWLTDPKNLVLGTKREIRVHREFKPKKDTIEYTMFCRIGVAVENPQAAVVVKNIRFND